MAALTLQHIMGHTVNGKQFGVVTTRRRTATSVTDSRHVPKLFYLRSEGISLFFSLYFSAPQLVNHFKYISDISVFVVYCNYFVTAELYLLGEGDLESLLFGDLDFFGEWVMLRLLLWRLLKDRGTVSVCGFYSVGTNLRRLKCVYIGDL